MYLMWPILNEYHRITTEIKCAYDLGLFILYIFIDINVHSPADSFLKDPAG